MLIFFKLARLNTKTILLSFMEDDLNIQIPVFHPVWQREPSAWFPGDEKTSALIAGEHIWDDILRLIKIRAHRKDEYDRKLLLKYIGSTEPVLQKC